MTVICDRPYEAINCVWMWRMLVLVLHVIEDTMIWPEDIASTPD